MNVKAHISLNYFLSLSYDTPTISIVFLTRLHK
mgnify:CR=1 FL=1